MFNFACILFQACQIKKKTSHVLMCSLYEENGLGILGALGEQWLRRTWGIKDRDAMPACYVSKGTRLPWSCSVSLKRSRGNGDDDNEGFNVDWSLFYRLVSLALPTWNHPGIGLHPSCWIVSLSYLASCIGFASSSCPFQSLFLTGMYITFINFS